ncbi:MAG: universal stress protein [Cyanophyceae cyanobacterium]
MFQRCLICTDFSDGLERLVSFVPQLASSGLQQIVFLHSVPLWEQGSIPRVDEDKVAAAKEHLSQALNKVPEGVDVRIEVPSGKPTDHILRTLKEYQSEVVLLGTPVRSSLQEKFVGSTSMGLAKQTPTPLMIFRPQLITTYTQEELALRCQHLWRYLLIPFNDSKTAQYLIERIKDYTQNCPSSTLEKCMLIWVIEDGPRQEVIRESRREEAQKKLAAVKAELEELGLQVNTAVREGNGLQEILQAALTFDISAIAIATDYRSNPLEWTVSSFANEVLHKSWFPLLFFSPKK